MPVDHERIGLSPFDSPLSVLHVTGPDGGAGQLAAAHRAQGWQVRVCDAGVEPLPKGADVVVLHGAAAGRLRRVIRGETPTVLIAEPGSPRLHDFLVERMLARWTSIVVVPDGATASRWNSRVPVPLVRVAMTGSSGSDLMAAVFARADCFGSGVSR
ncbi:hypothetical protein [Pseudonocardia abyssalis]|uniref:Uncharacterized protein n=1 Tax=Pseudonocardia abyssalis TaxID=2792008 RepID=A0ABS6UV72_9PSEU|nr:hypothetical protein [Pseudonocardia abyssalis]MBW0114576.1 hypothetical protein [Pseudonocardia abyssalis]MBW0135733.1 hypothetical protein [Pseudonocardia abyssalis]